MKDALVLSAYDIVLTTYGVLGSDYATQVKEERSAAAEGANGAGSSSTGGASAASTARLVAPFAVQWRRIILDEAHYI